MKPKILMKYLVIVIIIISINIAVLSYFEVSRAEALPKFYVDDDYSTDTPGWGVDHFDNIQDAIDAATSGDRILVYAGTYSENIIIDSTKVDLDLFGEDRAGTIINGGGTNDVIIVSATGVDIGTFTVKNSGSVSNNSVVKINADNCVITDCTISNGERGIFASNCDNIKIYYNTISTNDGDGIYLNNSNSNEITYNIITGNNNGIFFYNSSSGEIGHCTIQSNNENGIFLNETCDSNTISNNNISSNTKNGIYFDDHCDSNTISNNDVWSNSYSGIRLENSSSNNLGSNTVTHSQDYGVMIVGSTNRIHNSTINYNGDHGVFLFGDDESSVADNLIQYNTKDGIRMQNSTSDTVTRNRIFINQRYGIYLNYFTINNQVYNNFFKNNVDNARDLSENHNTWYLTKTLGSNIVSGSYISGNYWSNFDEVSDGAIDSDDDGIADNAKSINVSSSDSGALLDTTLPSIGTPSASPSSQSSGGYTYISATVTDNVDIKTVRLVVVNPNGQTDNFSIIQNNTGSTYYCNKIFSVVGDYSFFIYAKDPRNSAISATGSFSIHEGDPPSITDNSPTSGSPGDSFTFNATISSGSTSVSNLTAWVTWSHSSISGNLSMVNVAGNYFEKTIFLDNSIDNLTYHFYAKDQWGNSVTASTTTVTVTDTQAPTITIERYGSSFDDLPNSYTFAATITDDSVLSAVTIEYWYGNSEKMTVDMENTASNYYQKVITPTGSQDKVYCVIYANDTSGNQANTKNPYAKAGGSYSGYVTQTITFNGTSSFDLDGSISAYSWDFGDGNSGTGVSPTHAYSAKGDYTVTLTVTDNDNNTNLDTTYINIIALTKITASSQTVSDLETEFNITLNERFCSYDTDGDGKTDTFVDPNNILQVLHSGYVNINNHASFLLSVNGNLERNFIWDAEADKVINVTYQTGVITNDVEDSNNGIRTVTVEVAKAAWTYFEINDKYPDTSSLTIERSDGSEISSDMFWRKNNKIYVLDDPDTTYNLIYSSTSASGDLKDAVFSPNEGSTINEDTPTIIISYNVEVDVSYAVFYRLNDIGSEVIWSKDITLDLETDDYKKFYYTPSANLENGRYYLEIDVQDADGNTKSNDAYYEYQSYAVVEMEIPFTTLLILLGGILAARIIINFILKRKNITLESFVYIKNRKILPFFKPVVFGPLRINVDDKKVSKAEFYVNGKLKETVAEAPYMWTWNEPAFMKQNIETKIYDQNGNGNSSGEMTFYMFNPTRARK